MSLENNLSQISDSWTSLSRFYSKAQDEWNDDVSNEFDNNYWSELYNSMKIYLAALNQLNDVIQGSKREIN